MDRDAALDELFAAGLEDFTATRDALAARLSGADAAAVRSIKKPNLAAWATNQLSRRHPEEVGAVFDVTERLRHAQRRVLSGGKATELRKATDERQKIVGRLQRMAAAILEDAGHRATPATLQGVADSLMAVASDEAGGELVRRGRLVRPLEPSAFIDVSGLTLVPAPDDDDAGDEQDGVGPDAARIQEAKRRVSELRGTVKDARETHTRSIREAEKLVRLAEEAERTARACHEEAEFARRAAEARKQELDEAEGALEAAQAALRDLERS